MNLTSAVDQAHAVSGPKSAAKLYNSIEHELELGGDGSEESYEQGEEALGVLRERFPGVAGQARNVTSPPALSRAANTNLHTARHRRQPALKATTRRAHELQKRQPNRTPRERLAHATVIHTTGRRVASSAGTRWGQTGIPAAAESAAQLIMRTLGGIAGLSFLYLLLKPNGVKAVQTAGNTFSGAIAGLVSSKVDPLQGIGRLKTGGVNAVTNRGLNVAGNAAGNVAGEANVTVASAAAGVLAAGQGASRAIKARVGPGASKPTPTGATP